VAGFVATGWYGGDGELLEVPYATGVEAAKKLAAHCDVLAVWGLSDLAAILPRDRPKVIAVHHSDASSGWSNDTILKQLDVIDEVVCIHPGVAELLSGCGKPVHLISNAINPDRIEPTGKLSELRGDHGINADAKIVLFGHRLSEEKRPTLAVQIAQNLPEDWVMVIAGNGPEQSAAEAAAAGCDRVRFVGPCESLADWLAVSSCFLSLSTFEGFGFAIGESMAAGVPTVATPAGIAPGLATTLPTNSPAAEWAQAIVNAKVQVQPAEILERFSVARMVDAWAEIFKSSTP
jgi:glycosyltransferase involved in cell wall biosynthesis